MATTFEPIAIVGRSCVLPGALSPRDLWAHVHAGRTLIGPVPDGRWRLGREHVMGTHEAWSDRAWSDVGGYVTGFDARFDPSGFALPADTIAGLDPVFRWTLHGVREALASCAQEPASRARTGLVLGNLSFPTSAMAAYAEATWLAAQGAGFLDGRALELAQLARPHAYNRFMSGLPAQLTARALGLGAGAFALDAACASSLYAIKLACDRLHDRTADVMVAGAASAADGLFIHIGFCALAAMSKSGQSRPFHKQADGLVPAEGAAFVVLRRLADARADGDTILGVIRGVGLSNDGRGRGLLAPSEEGQIRAMRSAYALAGLSPRDIGLVECHATGTAVGDATEVRSTSRVFEGCGDVPMGSLKSNLGHLITAAGVAGVLKVLGALEADVRPPTLHAAPDDTIDALAGSPFRLVRAPEPWVGPRRAAVSAFGFGGNNAHLIVEAWQGEAIAVARRTRAAPIALVGLGVKAGQGADRAAFARTLASGGSDAGARDVVMVDAPRVPPRDLEVAHAQQLLMLEAAREAVAGLELPRDGTAVLVGMGCDPEVARYGARWRLADWAERWAAARGEPAPDGWVAHAREAFERTMVAASVVGTMPNIIANRINGQHDFAAPSFSLSAEEHSGLVALEVAARALREGEIDAAVVGAVDLSHEPVHEAALAELGRSAPSGDGAVAIVLKRLDDARRDGDPVLAVLEGDVAAAPGGTNVWSLGDVASAAATDPAPFDVTAVFGKPHAAAGLMHVAAAAVGLAHRQKLRARAPAVPWLGAGPRRASVAVCALMAPAKTLTLAAGDALRDVPDGPWALRSYAGADRAAVQAALAAEREGGDGPARLVLIAPRAELAARSAQAAAWLASGAAGPAPEGVGFRERPIGGEVAFVFTGGAAGYEGMGRELALAFPELVAALEQRWSGLVAASSWVYEGGAPKAPLDRLWGTSFVCQLHAELTQRVLGLAPQATLGYSSGETNALYATGAWRDLDALIRDSRDGALFSRELGGDFAAARRAWTRLGAGAGRWTAWVVSAGADEVRAALAGEPLAHLTIVNSPDEHVIGGEAHACARVVARLGRARAVELDYAIVAHAPEVEESVEAWRALHLRPTATVPGVRLYSNAAGRPIGPGADAAADAITGQAIRTLDFPRTVESAYADGVRVFIEHGPRAACTGWIRRTLGTREHLAVALDAHGRSGVRQCAHTLATLMAAGVAADGAMFVARLNDVAPAPSPARAGEPAGPRAPAPASTPLRLRAHPAPVVLPPFEARAVMLPAPRLPSLFDDLVAAGPIALAAPADAATSMPAPLPEAQLAPAPTPLPAPRAPNAAPALAGPFDALVAFQAQVTALHRDFLADQSAMHARFMALQARIEAHFVAAQVAGLAPVPSAPAVRETQFAPAAANIAVDATFAAPFVAHSHVPAATTMPPVPASPALNVAAATLPGPKFDRRQLETLASGRISSVFGPLFAEQDDYRRQCRMPEPPLLLADRVTGIDAVAGSMKTGTLWTETDVTRDAWYLGYDGRMPAGIMIESGQADLLLISWLGADLVNRGERIYRLLGCELTWHGPLPAPGDTLVYDIHVDGHASQGDIRLFFFHYDCRIDGVVRLSVRHGQAGFFTDAELASSGGVLWSPSDEAVPADARLDAPPRLTSRRSFGRADLVALSEGRAADCFGHGFELTRAHVRSPRIAPGRMLFLDRVDVLDPRGGPWQRGYLRAEQDIALDAWFFDGHFKNDPCMPGTLMFEGCVQAMSLYLAALGFTVERDGWRFEPVPEEKYLMRCRGQVTPASRLLVYEVFVREVHDGPTPALYADLLCTVDGLKAFYARRVGLRLVPDWPLEHWRALGPHREQPTGEPVPLASLGGLVPVAGAPAQRPAAVVDGFTFDYASLLACAWGKPSNAFGPFYRAFDSHRRVARLPGPPYHFMSRVTRIDAAMGAMAAGGAIEVEYDVPERVWYLAENGAPTMPLAVVMEAALQPCGWLASFTGCTLAGDVDMLFRNLDGTATLHAEILPGRGPLRTRTKLVSMSRTPTMIIVNFEVECTQADARVYDMRTVFGFFPKEAFDNQVGLPVSDAERARLAAPPATTGEQVDLGRRPPAYCGGSARLAGPMLLMLDRLEVFEPAGGRAGLGYARAVKDVDAGEWFFKAHFFQDPVQPGSLGIEALAQLLQLVMLRRGMADGLAAPRFEPLMTGRALTWKYRGQVVPTNGRIASELEVTELGEDERGRFAVADAWLWVDGKRIYHAKNLGMRLVPGGEPRPARAQDVVVDPAIDTWLGDHRPTWTMPAMPMMSLCDGLAAAAEAETGRRVTRLHDVRVHRWLAFPDERAVTTRVELTPEGDALRGAYLAWRELPDPARARFEPVANGLVCFDANPPPPAPWDPPADAVAMPDPYDEGRLFHGPAFQLLTSLHIGPSGASATLDLARCRVPHGALHPGVLDALLHAVPHDELWRWAPDVARDLVMYPYRLDELRSYERLPDRGTLRVEARFAGFDDNPRLPIVALQGILDGRVVVALRLVEVLLPKGALGRPEPRARRAFLRDRLRVPGVSLSRLDDDAAHLTEAEVREVDWLPGNVARIFAAPEGAPLVELVAAKEHVARRAFVHPAHVVVAPDLASAVAAVRPFRRHPIAVTRSDDGVHVRDDGPSRRDFGPIREHWRRWFGIGAWPVEDVFIGLIDRFVGDVIVADPAAVEAVRGRGCLFLANHQVGIESLLFSIAASTIFGRALQTLAKIEHRETWIGKLIAQSFSYPGIVDPRVITFFDRRDRSSLVAIVAELKRDLEASHNVLVHVEGTRSKQCRVPVAKLSSIFIDLAIAARVPIVPTRFVGGLPVEPLAERRDFPVGWGRQDYWIGSPILPEQLASLPLKDRTEIVRAAINGLGPPLAEEIPAAPDPELERDVLALAATEGITPDLATLRLVVERVASPSPGLADMLGEVRAGRGGRLALRDDPIGRWLAALARMLYGARIDGPPRG